MAVARTAASARVALSVIMVGMPATTHVPPSGTGVKSSFEHAALLLPGPPFL